ncbi:hypothetical protein [Psychrobacillus sp. L3]|uniref:hypothetical protein n=1 Tax=Psychrobacillus sp. L3 TaxID=3236891 RepID=UPI0036F1D078
MMKSKGNLLHTVEYFTKIHDDFLKEWDLAMLTGDTSKVEIMSDNYFVTFFNRKDDKPSTFNREEAIDGMHQSVNSLLGAKKRFENRIIRMRNHESFVVFYELIIEKESRELARFFTIENWQYKDKKWEIVRELEEHI